MDEKSARIAGRDFHLDLDANGCIAWLSAQGETVELPAHYPLFEIDDEPAEVNPVRLAEGEASFRLSTRQAAGKLTVSGGAEIRFHWQADPGSQAGEIGFALAFPLGSRFHIPEGHNIGRMIDREMPIGEWYSPGSYPLSRYTYLQRNRELYKNGLSYGFFLAEVDGSWLRFMIRENSRRPDVHISRHEESFVVTFRWPADLDALLSVFPSMEAAVADFQGWMEQEFGIRKLMEDPAVPAWVHDVRLVFIVDMLRGNWEISHDYADVTAMAKELRRAGCPKETLFYLPGWNGAYDSTYPTYEAHADLGGETKLREMIDTLHECGYRAMIHTNAWGLDPCHPKIDEWIKYARPDQEGSYEGWQSSIPKLKVNRRLLKFRTNLTHLSGPASAGSFVGQTVEIPQECEAFMTIGGLKAADARIKLTVDRRSVVSPPGWFVGHEEYAYPFPLTLKAGANEVRLEAPGRQIDWSGAWYKVRYCFIPPTPYTSWTYPILSADTSNPEWIGIYVENVAAAVNKYGIDAVHVDATGYEKHPAILKMLKESLPGVAIAGEGYSSLEALGFWAISQGARQSLTAQLAELQGTKEQAALPDRSQIESIYRWLNKTSPVADFVKEYIRLYPHLCAADAFVPAGKVCNTFPARLSPRDPQELWRVLRDAKRLGYIPGLRLNYREYGLDSQTRKAVREIARTSRLMKPVQ